MNSDYVRIKFWGVSFVLYTFCIFVIWRGGHSANEEGQWLRVGWGAHLQVAHCTRQKAAAERDSCIVTIIVS